VLYTGHISGCVRRWELPVMFLDEEMEEGEEEAEEAPQQQQDAAQQQ
jgi:hypothetical protein